MSFFPFFFQLVVMPSHPYPATPVLLHNSTPQTNKPRPTRPTVTQPQSQPYTSCSIPNTLYFNPNTLSTVLYFSPNTLSTVLLFFFHSFFANPTVYFNFRRCREVLLHRCVRDLRCDSAGHVARHGDAPQMCRRQERSDS